MQLGAQRDISENYSVQQRKLKRITQELPFNPPPAQHIEDRINQMRQKIAKQTEVERKQAESEQDNGSELPRPRQRIQTEAPIQYNPVTSLLTDRLSKGSILNRTNNDLKIHSKQPLLENYKEERVMQDKSKYPLKYKIIKEQIGIKKDARVYDLRNDQVQRIQEQFMRRKGLEYLREGNSAARWEGRRFYSNNKGRTPSLRNVNSNSKIHQIFGNPISQSKRVKSDKSLKPKRGRQLEELREQQEMLGKIVFQKVKKHLRQQKEEPNYFRRVYTEETIDEALVDFLKVKIERAEVSLK